MYKILALLFLLLPGCSQAPIAHSGGEDIKSQDAAVAASLSRIDSVNKSTKDMFDEMSTKTKAGS